MREDGFVEGRISMVIGWARRGEIRHRRVRRRKDLRRSIGDFLAEEWRAGKREGARSNCSIKGDRKSGVVRWEL
jgi:hypothetical protein